MRKGRLPAGHGADLLDPLVPYAPLLYLEDDQVRVHSKLDVPHNEFGIPLRQEFLALVLGSVATGHTWIGREDEHHICWPGANYTPHNHLFHRIGTTYRGTGGMKMLLPRQLHEYIHAATHPPEVPSEEVMTQYAAESRNLQALYQMIRPTKLEKEAGLLDADLERERYAKYLHRLEGLPEGQVGFSPPLDELAAMSLDTARAALAERVCVLVFSNTPLMLAQGTHKSV